MIRGFNFIKQSVCILYAECIFSTYIIVDDSISPTA